MELKCIGLTGQWGDKPSAGPHCLVIYWHDGWLSSSKGKQYWTDLREGLKAVGLNKILVVVPSRTPEGAATPEVLFQAIAENATSGTGDFKPGWVYVGDTDEYESMAAVWTPKEGAAMLKRLCDVCVALMGTAENWPAIKPTPAEFFEFLESPEVYRARKLHAAQGDKAKAMGGLRLLKRLASHVLVPALPLKILVVENEPDRLAGFLKGVESKFEAAVPEAASFFTLASVYLLEKKDEALAALRADEFEAKKWTPGDNENAGSERVSWSDIDLVLQDIVLDGKTPRLDGLELVSHYFKKCPQALTFLLTSLDVESLVGSGDVNWRYADAIVSKDATETLSYEYRRCFHERFGRMFWPDWPAANGDDRKLLRGLFSSLRRWQIEPDILWHGQSLPEMIDHAHRHASALWRLTNDFVGTIMESGGANREALNLRRRVCLAVAVWLHDMGHRGDEYVSGSMAVRASHAGISDRLLLRNPEAYGLAWLLAAKEIPHAPCCSAETGQEKRLACRNETCCFKEAGLLCMLRQVGLLCRHHQSNAPLDKKSLAHMAGRGKSPSVYSLVPAFPVPELTGEEFLRRMTNDALPNPAPFGTEVRTLEDFNTGDKAQFRSVAGLLRLLDALQLHRERVGTAAFLASFEEFIETRFKWCSSERVRLDKALRAATPGTLAYQRAVGELDALAEYELLLSTQNIHFWRQAAVHDVRVRWARKVGGKSAVEILFTLNETALAMLEDMKTQFIRLRGDLWEVKLYKEMEPKIPTRISVPPLSVPPHQVEGAKAAIVRWIFNLADDVIGTEHKSQYMGAADRSKGYLGVISDGVKFSVGISGTDVTEFENPFWIYIPPP